MKDVSQKGNPLDSAFGKLQKLGIDAGAEFQNSEVMDAGESLRIMSDRSKGLVRVRINTPQSLLNKVLRISQRLRHREVGKQEFYAQGLALLNLTRIFAHTSDFQRDALYLQYVEDLELSNVYVFQICDLRTDMVKMDLTIHVF